MLIINLNNRYLQFAVVTKCHRKYVAEIGIQPKTEAYIQSLMLRKTLESLSFDRRRGFEEERLTEVPEEMCKRIIVSELVVDTTSA